MKKKWWLINSLVCLLIVGLTLLGAFLFNSIKEYREFNKKYTFDVNKVNLLTFDRADLFDNNYKSFSTDDIEEIEIFKKCAAEVKRNNDAIKRDQIGPAHHYEFTVDFKNSFSEKFIYQVYLTDDVGSDPFNEFFSLPSVIEKMNGSN